MSRPPHIADLSGRPGAGGRRLRLRIGIDSGGTFTDFYVSARGQSFVFKVPSTPDDPARAVLDGLEHLLGMRAWDSAESAARRKRTRGPVRPAVGIVHGTTVGTNALLTRSGARTALVTTAGFEDLIEIGRQNRDSLYDLAADRPPPLAARHLRFGLRERVFVVPAAAERGPHRGRGAAVQVEGRVPPSPRAIARLLGRLRAARVESVAVGFLHSYLDPSNERRVERALEAAGLSVTASHRISSEYREYERFQTALANAYLQPIAGHYLSRLASGVRPARLTVLQSDGTTATPAAASREPVRTVLSGPAGGALAARVLARRLGDRRVLAFDMGGTSTDTSLIDGDLPRTSQGRVAGLPIRSPMIEVHTVGAGGGSVARRDAAGALRVGPESAGADPGPACYGRGTLPTVTDAHLILGRLGENDLLGGEFPVDARRARLAAGVLARSLAMSVEETAEGILEVVEATMERALRAVSIGRGKDPRRFALYAFGGAGGLHACRLAERLGIRRVVIPPGPGVFSASGLAAASPGVETSATLFAALGDRARIGAALRVLEAQAMARLEEQGIDQGAFRVRRFADLRYEGQSHEIMVPYGGRMARAFVRAHRDRYGHEREGARVEVVTLRVRASVPTPRSAGSRGSNTEGPAQARVRGKGVRVLIVFGGRRVSCRVIARATLGSRMRIAGPARITEYSGTTFVPPGWRASPGPAGTLVLGTVRARAQKGSGGT